MAYRELYVYILNKFINRNYYKKSCNYKKKPYMYITLMYLPIKRNERSLYTVYINQKFTSPSINKKTQL